MGFVHTFRENFEISVAGSPGTYSAAAQATSWVELATAGREAVLVAQCGELDGDMVVAVWEAQDNAGTGAQAIAGLTGTFLNGSSEGGYGLITVRSDDMTDGYTHVTAYVTPSATDAFSGCWIVGQLYDHPATNANAVFSDYL